MKSPIRPSAIALAFCAVLGLALRAGAADAGFTSLFDGKSLDGWDGNPKFWSVRDGAITGQTTADNPTQGNTFLIWKGGAVEDFELRLAYKIVGDNPRKQANSGIQYRSKDHGNWVVGGYQADFEAGRTYSGINYEERGRGILAQRGQVTILKADPADAGKVRIEVAGQVGKSEEIQAVIKDEDWNDYTIIARGNQMTHIINGRVTSMVIDEHAGKAATSGILALQLHAGPPMTVQFKNIQMRKLGGGSATTAAATAASDLDRMQGVWGARQITIGGNDANQEQLDAVQLTIRGKNFESKWSDGQDSGTLEVREKGSPRQLDIASTAAGAIPAIYEFTGDALRVCYAFNGAPRPPEFSAPANSERILVVYVRKK